MHVMQKVQATVTCKITQQSRSSMSWKKQIDQDNGYYLRFAVWTSAKLCASCMVPLDT